LLLREREAARRYEALAKSVLHPELSRELAEMRRVKEEHARRLAAMLRALRDDRAKRP